MNSNYQGYIRDHSEEQSNRNQYERCEKDQEVLVNETGEKKTINKATEINMKDAKKIKRY